MGIPVSFNPYETPTSDLQTPVKVRGQGFLTGWTITDLVFSGLRIIFILLAIAGYKAMIDSGKFGITGLVDISSQIGIFIFGIAGNILLLFKKRAGLYIGIIAAICTFIHITNSVIQVNILTSPFKGTPQYVFMWIGGIFTMIIRIALNGIYVYVLYRYSSTGLLKTTNSNMAQPA